MSSTSRAWHPPLARADEGRSSPPALGAALVLIALVAGTFGLGHDHAGGEALDEHHCVICHAQQTTILPTTATDQGPAATPRDGDPVDEPGLVGSIAPGLRPPLRGPPAS